MKKIFFISLLLIFLSTSESKTNISATYLNKKPLKVGLIVENPYVFKQNNQYSGLIISIWQEIIKLSPMKYNFIPVGESWVQATQDLIKKKYDILLGDFAYSSERAKVVQYTHPFLLTYMSILTLKPTTERIIRSSFIVRFSTIFISIIIIYLLCSYLYAKIELKNKKVTSDTNKKEKAKTYSLWIISRTLLSGGLADPPSTILGRILIIIVLILGIIFISLISAGLSSDAILSKTQLQTFPDYFSLQGKTFLYWGKTDFYQSVIGKWGALTKGISLKDNIYEIYIKNTDKYDGIVADYPVNLYLLNKSKNQNIHIESLKLNQEILSFIVPLKSPYLENIDNALITLKHKGVIQKICEQTFNKKECSYLFN